MKKEKYVELMDKTLGAYTTEHIVRYFSDVKRDGITEHGFPRLTANIGILIAKGRRKTLLPLFTEMMDYCCEFFTGGIKAANDFSVKEIIFCLLELEAANIFPKEKTDEWRALLAKIDNRKCYTQYAKTPDDIIYNWACFTGVSEQLRKYAGIFDDSEFIDYQMASQLKFFDENGMYRDPHEPMVYDLVTRGLYAAALHFGYNGKYAEKMDGLLRRAGLMTLKMQSVTGEIPYGGRSAQFLHNEAHQAIISEFEASRYAREGNLALAGKFKASAERGVENIEKWLAEPTVRHIKNRYPLDTGFGCEGYAYFDKYMITAASFLYVAYCMADDAIVPDFTEEAPYTLVTSEHFHKLFLSAGDYFAEFDTQADFHYDSNGLGRLHKRGAPSALCLSTPCTTNPNYNVSDKEQQPLSIAHGIFVKDKWHFATRNDIVTDYQILSHTATETAAIAKIATRVGGNNTVFGNYTLTGDGLSIELSGDGRIGLLLPVFDLDGEGHTEISLTDKKITVAYRGYVCEYTTDGSFASLGYASENRNGKYLAHVAEAKDRLTVNIRIYEK